MSEQFKSRPFTREEMEVTRIARFGQRAPLEPAFIDSFLPEYEKKLHKIINKGATENLAAQPAIQGEHSFALSIIQMAPGKGAALHSHETEEVFVPLNGDAVIFWGDEAEHEATLGQWDVFSVPTGVMRGFRNPNAVDLFMLVVVGGADQQGSRIEWHPELLRKAREMGKQLDANGSFSV